MPNLVFLTAGGELHIELHDEQAPHTCRYFVDAVRDKAFDSGAIFRITTANNAEHAVGHPIEVVQFGTSRGLDESPSHIRHESTKDTGLRHRRWTVSASRFAPGEVYRSFFICMRDEPMLD